MPPLTAEKVADYLPLAGKMPHISGRIINVTHQIPYHVSRTMKTVMSPSMLSSVREDDDEFVQGDVAAAPISKVARNHHRRRTIRAQFRSAEWTIVQDRGHGALNSGLQGLDHGYDTLVIGWTGPIVDDANKNIKTDSIAPQDKESLEKLLMDTGHIIPIFLDDCKSRGHYEGYCKEILWPLFHYLVWSNKSDGRTEKQYWADYVSVNQQFADTIAANYRPGDVSKYI
jgi:trehalose 6-phosphate synthase/phosphatase